LEKYEEIPSDSGIPFNEQPKMKAMEVAEKAKDAILSGKYDQVLAEMRSLSINHAYVQRR
jgi:2,3-bisphosphoglycerate-independent phosphoglycerate mutase